MLELKYKTFRRNMRGKTSDIGFGNDFLDITPKIQETKENPHGWENSVEHKQPNIRMQMDFTKARK